MLAIAPRLDARCHPKHPPPSPPAAARARAHTHARSRAALRERQQDRRPLDGQDGGDEGHQLLWVRVVFPRRARALRAPRSFSGAANTHTRTQQKQQQHSFNNGQTMVDGLWAGQSSLTLDFSTVAYRQALLGFNAVRLPFSFKDFEKPGRFYWPCRVASEDEIRKSVTPPGACVVCVCCVLCVVFCVGRGVLLRLMMHTQQTRVQCAHLRDCPHKQTQPKHNNKTKQNKNNLKRRQRVRQAAAQAARTADGVGRAVQRRHAGQRLRPLPLGRPPLRARRLLRRRRQPRVARGPDGVRVRGGWGSVFFKGRGGGLARMNLMM